MNLAGRDVAVPEGLRPARVCHHRAVGPARNSGPVHGGFMSTLRFRLLAAVALLAALVTIGCVSAENMTPKQREAVEHRRYCERNYDVEKCVGFLGRI